MKNRIVTLVMAVFLIISTAVIAGCSNKTTQPQNTEGTKNAGQSQASGGSITIAGSTSVQPLSEELAKAFKAKNGNTSIAVNGGGSSVGIKAATEGTADIGSSSRELKDSEKELKEFVIAVDGIAVIVNPANKVEDLKKEDLKKIFMGEIKNWKDIGGVDASIVVYNREEGSGTRKAFQELVLGKNSEGKENEYSADALVQNSTGGIAQSVGGDLNGIGYASLGVIEKETKVKMVKVDGAIPSLATIKDKSYKISRPFLYLTKEEPKGAVKEFIDWVISPEGQQIVKKDYISPGDLK